MKSLKIKTKKKTQNTRDKDQRILNTILNAICEDEEAENAMAREVVRATEGQVTEAQFHNWIVKFDLDVYFKR